jgi:hypothetical protein
MQFGTKPTVEGCRALAITGWVRDAVIRPGTWWSGSTSWRNKATGEPLGSIGVEARVDEDGTGLVRLTYKVTPYGGESVPVDLPVRLTSVPRHLGGRQWYFVCPLVVDGARCGRRAATLYLRDGCSLFGCRICLDLAYRSSQQAHAAERRDRVLAKLAWHGGMRRLIAGADRLPPGELLALIRGLY